MSNQSELQKSIRGVTATYLNYEGDWHSLFDVDSVPDGSFNSRLLFWINSKLSSSYTNIQSAKAAFAENIGVTNWNDVVSIYALPEPTFDFTTSQNNVTTINDTFNAATDHTFVIDLVIPDPETAPSNNETIFAYGLSNAGSNNIQLRRRTSSSDIQALLVAGNGTLGGFSQFFPSEMQYINKKMRIGIVLKASGVQEIYINGRQWMTSTGKSTPLTNANTVLCFNAAYRTDTASSYGTRLRYYNYAQTRSAMELITNVSLSELGLSYSKDVNALAIVGQGQSQMSGAESVSNKTIMPEVATGRLKLLNTNGSLEAFSESWYDPNGRNPLFKAFSQTFVGDSYEYFAGYMGRIGNDIAAAKSQNVIVTCAAASGTKISAEWAAARTDLNTGLGTTTNIGYMTFCLWEAVRQANALAGKVILYLDQGQGDALDGMSEAAYETQLQAMIDWLNYYYPALEYYIVGFNAYNASSGIVEADWNNIIQARKDVASANADCVFIDIEDVVITNPDGLHFLNANQEIVGARSAKHYTGGDTYELTNPSSGNSEPTEFATLNTTKEGTIVATYTPTDLAVASDQYIVHINRGGTSPAAALRIFTNDTTGNVYRDDAGNVSSGAVTGSVSVEDVKQSMVASWSNREGKVMMLFENLIDNDTFTPDDGSFASEVFTDLEIASRNGGSNPLSGSVQKVIISDTFLDPLVASKLRQNDDRFVLLGGGQSLVKEYWDSTESNSAAGIASIISTMRGFDSDLEVITYNASEGGSALDPRSIAGDANQDEFWLDEGNHVAQELKQFLDAVKLYGLYDAEVIWDLGITDSHVLDTADNVTLEEFKQKTLILFNIVRSVSPDIKFNIINLARRAAFANTGGYQKLRDMYKDLASSYSWISLCPETYDAELLDNVHRTDTGIAVIAPRLARHFAYKRGETVTGSIYGAQITSATRSGTTVTVSIEHDGGTDFTPTTAIQGFVFHDDGVAITINSAVRTDATTITLTLNSEPSGVETLYYGYDAMLDITDTTKIVKDNSPQALPLQTCKIVLS